VDTYDSLSGRSGHLREIDRHPEMETFERLIDATAASSESAEDMGLALANIKQIMALYADTYEEDRDTHGVR